LSGDDKIVEGIKNQIAAEEEQVSNARKSFALAREYSKGGIMDMALGLDMMSDKVLEKTALLFKNMRDESGLDIFSPKEGDKRAVEEYMKTILKLSDDATKKMMGVIYTSKENINAMNQELKATSDYLTASGKAGGIAEIINTDMADNQINIKETREALEKYVAANDLKIDISLIMRNLEKMPVAVQKLMNEGYESARKDIEDTTLSGMKNVEIISGETGEDQAKRLDDLVKNTHTIEDFIGINKENAEYFLASNDLQRTMADAAIATARSTASILHFVQKIAKGDKVAKTEEEFRDTETYKKTLPNLMAKQLILTDELNTTNKNDAKKREDIQKKLDKVNKDIKSKAGDYSYLTSELAPEALKRSKAAAAEHSKTVGLYKEYSESNRGAEARDVMGAYKQQYGDISPISSEELKQKKDYKASTGGYALLSRGDVVVNAKSMSRGIGGDLGAFSGQVLPDMMRSRAFDTGGMAQAPSIPVTISIGSVNGNPEEFLKSIKPAIEQAFERLYFDKQKRR
jgi:hypothetical protein